MAVRWLEVCFKIWIYHINLLTSLTSFFLLVNQSHICSLGLLEYTKNGFLMKKIQKFDMDLCDVLTLWLGTWDTAKGSLRFLFWRVIPFSQSEKEIILEAWN